MRVDYVVSKGVIGEADVVVNEVLMLYEKEPGDIDNLFPEQHIEGIFPLQQIIGGWRVFCCCPSFKKSIFEYFDVITADNI